MDAKAEASSSSKSTADRNKERMEKLKKLHLLRNTARKQNHTEVVAEDARAKLPKNWESRQAQAEWLINDEKARAEAAAKGLDYDRVKLNNLSAIEAERSERKKKKKNPDPGFSDYEAQTARQYGRLVKQITPNMDKYEKRRQELGDEIFYGGAHTIMQGTHKDSKDAIDNMVKDIEQQIDKRKKFSRRRMHNDDADIDFINERNSRFNKKLDRFYGEHTAEIKQNLERGTAI